MKTLIERIDGTLAFLHTWGGDAIAKPDSAYALLGEAKALIAALKARLHEQTEQTQITATQIRERVCEVLERHGVLPESLGHPIEQIVGRVVCDMKLHIARLTDALQELYDYHDAPAKCKTEYLEAVAEAGDVLAEAAKAAERGE